MLSGGTKAIVAALLAAAVPVYAGIDIKFDYSYDTTGFFNDPARRALLDAAAGRFEERLQDSLSAVVSTATEHYNFGFRNPSGTNIVFLPDMNLAANEIRVYVGARSEGYSQDASSVGGFWDLDPLLPKPDRGQTGANAATPTDFAPWGGSITFNWNPSVPWYFDPDPSTTESFAGGDFYTLAQHELGHVLGYGLAESWRAQVDGSNHVFLGASSVAYFGGPVPLAGQQGASDDHWSINVHPLPMMRPSLLVNQRAVLTELDWAGLGDIGWDVSPIPEAQTYAMMLAGLGVVGWLARRRNQR